MDNQQPVPRIDISKIAMPEIDISQLARILNNFSMIAMPKIDITQLATTMSKIAMPEIDVSQLATTMSKIAMPEIDVSQLATTMSKIAMPEIDISQLARILNNFSMIAMPKIDITQLATTMSKIDFYRTVSFPDGFFESIRVLDHSSKYPLSSFMAQGAVLDEYLSPDEANLLLTDGATNELRWSIGELWDSFTEQQQRFIKLGYLGGLFVAIFVAIFMAQTQYPEFGQFLESATVPAGLALFALSVVGPNLMKTKTHPINKRITRN